MSLLSGISTDMSMLGVELVVSISELSLDIIWRGIVRYGFFSAIGGLLAALVVLAVRLQAGRRVDQSDHPLLSRLVRHPDWLTQREMAVFVGLSVLFAIGFPGLLVIFLSPANGFSFLFGYPAAIVHGVVFGLVLALMGIGTVAVKLVTPWEEDILGFTAQYVAVGLLVGIWVSLWPYLWEPVVTWLTGG